MQGLNTRKILTILVPIVALFTVLLVGIFWTIPEVQEYLSSKEEQRAVDRQIELDLEPKRDTLQSTNVSEVANSINVISRALPEDASPAYVLANLEAIAAETGIELDLSAFTEIAVSENSESIILTVEFEATGEELQQFFNRLSTSAPLLFVSTFKADTLTEFNQETQRIEGARRFGATMRLVAPFSTSQSSQLSTGQSLKSILQSDDQIVDEIDALTDRIGSLEEFNNQNIELGKSNPFINS
ncbi:hypothetical protein KC573_04635 [candidate division WWE3 bacterium]|uniref:Uncharacterized protein n=1 Tax=candidate division WWE3 bacterium TaxID=2053526 RepID=A0A955LWZ1_UNCKA|nr:hypothetical protein [candidate division WWE3 bacterium]